MSNPLLEDSPQVSLVDRNQEIQTLAADSCYQAFAESVRLGRSERRFQDAQAHRLQSEIQPGGVNAITVMDDEAWWSLSCDCLPELLKSPLCGGMGGDVEVDDSARAHFHDHEDIQDTKASRHGGEEITG